MLSDLGGTFPGADRLLQAGSAGLIRVFARFYSLVISV